VGKTPETAKLLRALREETGRGLRQTANDLGVTPSYLSRVERGERSTNEELTKRVADYYGVDEEVIRLQSGQIPEDIVEILNAHPEILAELRVKYAKSSGNENPS
jgi:transcriptional regulator with XRE-family HTH domain